MYQNDMRRVINNDLRIIAQQIRDLILSPQKQQFGWWEVGRDIDPAKLIPMRDLWYDKRSGDEVWGFRFRFYHPNGKLSGGEIVFTNLRVASVISEELGAVSIKEANHGKSSQTFHFRNDSSEAIAFSREIEQSRESERSRRSETEAGVGIETNLTAKGSYLGSSISVSQTISASFRHLAEQQKRQLESFRELSTPQYSIPPKTDWKLVRELGQATISQDQIVKGSLDFDVKIWGGPKHLYEFESYDDLLDQASGIVPKNNPFAKFFGTQGNAISVPTAVKFIRPVVTIKRTTVNPASALDKRTIEAKSIK